MFLFGGVLGLLAIGVWIFCIIDVLTSPADRVRNLPKLAWVFIVILLVDVGSIAWLIAGRPWNTGPAVGVGSRRQPARPTNPDDDDEFLASLKKRADEQRRRAQGDDEAPA